MTLPVSAFIAANRFGLGAAPGELAAASIDPKAWLKSQLAGTPETPAALADLSDSADVLVELISKGPAAKAMRIQPGFPAGSAKLGSATLGPPKVGSGNTGSAKPELVKPQPAAAAAARSFIMLEHQRYVKEAAARTLAQVESRQPLRERLVAFWSNHFTVSVAAAHRAWVLPAPSSARRSGPMSPAASTTAARGRRAIRRCCSISTMPARSAPIRRPGQRRGMGLNENLAPRAAGAAHARRRRRLYPGRCHAVRAHPHRLVRSPAPRETRCRRFRVPPRHARAGRENPARPALRRGRREGRRCDAWRCSPAIPRRPATSPAKFARHFIADDPPPAAVDRLAEVFRDSDGDLPA